VSFKHPQEVIITDVTLMTRDILLSMSFVCPLLLILQRSSPLSSTERRKKTETLLTMLLLDITTALRNRKIGSVLWLDVVLYRHI